MVFLVIASQPASAATLRVHYDVGWGNRITIRGSHAPLSWSQGLDATWTAGNVWTYSWPDSAGDVEFKPLINDVSWSTGANYRAEAGATVDVYPFFGVSAGTMKQVDDFFSPQLNNRRSLRIYLPPSYAENPQKRYPVVYMHDGQNLFDPRTAFGGVEWSVDETINHLVGTGQMDEIIVVGIDNTPDRIGEYTPCCDPRYGGGKIEAYSEFIIQTVKPYIDGNYRTLGDAARTAVMGSSLGGLASFHIGRHRPQVFSMSASLSGSFWWNNRQEVDDVAEAVDKVPGRYYMDAGTLNDGLADTRALRNAMLSDGYVQGLDLNYYVANGASHSEASWAARLDIPLCYLFPWGSARQ